MFKSPGNPENNKKNIEFLKILKILHVKDTEGLIQQLSKVDPKVKISLFLTIPTSFKDPNEIIFIFPTYSRPSRTRWCLFHKNQSQKNFDKNH